jgi:hypothetical protein
MRAFRWLPALLVLTGLAVPAQAETLQWVFKKDTPIYQEMTTTTRQDMKISGQSINQTQSQTFYFSWTPKKQDTKAGTWEIEQKIIGVKMTIEIGGNKIEYDSQSKEGGQSNPLGDFFKQLVNSTFTLTVNKKMEVTDIKGRQEFIDKLTKANQQMEPLLKEILTKDSLKQMADPAFSALPNKSVKKDESWTKDSTLNMGPIGKYKTEYKYTYEGKDSKQKDFDRIKVETKLTYIPPDAKGQPQLPFKITKANLTSKKSTGYILYDPKTNRVIRSEMELDLEGPLTIEIGGTATVVDLKQKQTTVVRTLDSNPIKKTTQGGGGAEK